MNRRWIGSLLMGTAVLHQVVGLFFYAQPLTQIINDGIFNAIAPSATQIYFDRDAAFWFLVTGVLLFALGQTVHWMQSRTGTLPAALGWWLLGLSIIGVILMPISGFWLIIPQAFFMLRVAGRKTAVLTT